MKTKTTNMTPRQEAMKKGNKFYTGKPCPLCGNTKRKVIGKNPTCGCRNEQYKIPKIPRDPDKFMKSVRYEDEI